MEESELNPISICSHLTADPKMPCAGLEVNGSPHWYCPDCLAIELANLLDTDTTPSEAAALVHVTLDHLSAITLAIHQARIALQNAGHSRVSNRLNVCKRAIYTRVSKEPRFKYGQDDGGPPSYRRTLKHYARIVELKSLSTYDGVSFSNRTVSA